MDTQDYKFNRMQTRQDMPLWEALEIIVMRLRSEVVVRNSLRLSLLKRFNDSYRAALKTADLTDEEKVVLTKMPFKVIVKAAIEQLIMDACSTNVHKLFQLDTADEQPAFEDEFMEKNEILMREFYHKNYKEFQKQRLSYAEWRHQFNHTARLVLANVALTKFKEKHGCSLLDYLTQIQEGSNKNQ